MKINLVRGLKREYINSIDKYNNSLFSEIKNKIKINEYSYKAKQFGLIRLFKQYVILPTKLFFNYSYELNYFLDPSLGLNLLFCPGKKVIVCYDLNAKKEGSLMQKLGYFLTIINWRYMKKADKIITISEYSKQEIIKKLKTYNIEIVNPAINHSIHKQKKVNKKSLLKKYNLPDKKIILYVGTEQNRKNVDKIIKAMSLLKDIIFVKIGVHQNSENRKKNLELIKELKLEKRVFILENVCEEDLVSFYNIAKVFVFPSVFEGFGIPPLEAMACGCPVITTHKTSLKEVVGDAAIILRDINEKEITKEVNKVLKNKKLREILIKKGLKNAKRFSWKKSAEKLYKILNNI